MTLVPPPRPAPDNIIGERIGAILIDGAIFGPLNLFTLFLAATAPSAVAITALLLAAPAPALYAALMHVRTGQTFGKQALGIEVARARDGRPVRLPNALLRELPGLLLTLTGALLLAQVVARGDGTLLDFYTNTVDIDRYRELIDRTEGEHVDPRVVWDATGLGRIPLAFWLNSALQWAWLAAEVSTMFTNSRHRALHDFIGGTVVRRKQPPPPDLRPVAAPHRGR